MISGPLLELFALGCRALGRLVGTWFSQPLQGTVGSDCCVPWAPLERLSLFLFMNLEKNLLQNVSVFEAIPHGQRRIARWFDTSITNPRRSEAPCL